jgi:hypothetical protein
MVEACAMDAINNVNKEQGVRQEELRSDFAKEKSKKKPHLSQKKKTNSRGKGVLGASIKSSMMVDDELVEINEDNIDEDIDNDWDYYKFSDIWEDNGHLHTLQTW